MGGGAVSHIGGIKCRESSVYSKTVSKAFGSIKVAFALMEEHEKLVIWNLTPFY